MILVSNYKSKNHLETINKIFESSEEIFIAVAFLKSSGLKLLISTIKKSLEDNTLVEIFVGTDFFQTEPSALKQLLTLKEKYSTCKVMIANQAQATFHPKIYMARRGESYRSLIGSANLTKGGVNSNEELSLFVTHTKSESLTKEIMTTFRRYRADLRFQQLDELFLEQYTSRYKINETQRKRFEKARDAALPNAFDLRQIEILYSQYCADDRAMSTLKNRRHQIKESLIIQNKIANMNPRHINANTKKTFEVGLRDLMGSKGGKHLWGSDGIYRKGHQVLEHPEEIIEFFSLAKELSLVDPFGGYEKIRSAGRKILGVGINMATEILCTFAPKRYVVYNGNTCGALKALGISVPKTVDFGTIGPSRYVSLCATIEGLRKRIGVKNLSEADAFLNWIYWKSKKN